MNIAGIVADFICGICFSMLKTTNTAATWKFQVMMLNFVCLSIIKGHTGKNVR
jgi:hypothetical protein